MNRAFEELIAVTELCCGVVSKAAGRVEICYWGAASLDAWLRLKMLKTSAVVDDTARPWPAASAPAQREVKGGGQERRKVAAAWTAPTPSRKL